MEKKLSSKAFWLIVDFEKAVKRDKENSTAETVAEYKETLSRLIDYITALEPDVEDNETVFEKMMKLPRKTLGEILQDAKLEKETK